MAQTTRTLTDLRRDHGRPATVRTVAGIPRFAAGSRDFATQGFGGVIRFVPNPDHRRDRAR